MRWTDEQISAIEGRGNLIVSAAAGAGKTAVLTERLCRLVETGVPVESLLVLTFTRAAAAEMKGRMEKRLRFAAENAGTDEDRARMARAAAAVNRASIQTIDGFCARIVHRHGHLLGLPPSARIADEGETASIAAECMDAFLTALSQSGDARLLSLYRAFGSERAAIEAIKTLDRFLDAKPYPEAWLSDAVRKYESDAYLNEILASAVEEARNELSLHVSALNAAKKTLSPDLGNAVSQLDDEVSRCRAVLLQESYEDYREGLFSVPFDALRYPRGTDEGVKAPVARARDALKKCVKSQRELFYRTEGEEKAALRASGEILKRLAGLTSEYRAAFTEKKRGANVLDYSDLGHMALNILDSEAVADEYRKKYRYIAIDEYQDTNRLNEEILLRVARKDNLFYVGDVKQSIYRFRQAEPSLFLEKLALFAGERGTRIDLVENFRSAKEVLLAVNETFSAVMTQSVGEMDYDERAALKYGAELPEGGARLFIIEKKNRGRDEHIAREEAAEPDADSENEADEAIEDAADATIEGRLAAREIKRLMETERVTDAKTGKLRALKYSDCAVLMRSVKFALPFVQALSREGVPASCEATGGYFDAIEVQILLNYLAVIDNRKQDIPLLSAMLSPFGNFTAAELAGLRAAHRAGFFYEAVFAAGENGNEKVNGFFAALARLNRESNLVPLDVLIGEILDESGYTLLMRAMLGGRVRMANIEALIEKARAFSARRSGGLSNFLSFLTNVKDNGGLLSAQDSNEDAVRVLSMHKSKGLEFPVVVLAGLGKKFNLDDGKKNLILHGDAGLGLRYIDAKTGLRMDTAARRMIAKRVLREQLAEEMRILYVAMTRARQQLILIGCAQNAESYLSSGRARPDPAEVANSRSLLKFLTLSARKFLPGEVVPRESLAPGQESERRPLPREDEAQTAKLAAALSFAYPLAPGRPLPAKTSVSRVDGARMEEAIAFKEPAFLLSEQTGALDVGTAAHAVLQRMELRPQSETEVKEAIDGFVEKGYLDDESAARVNAGRIAEFTRSALFARMAASPRLERETPFELAFPAERFFEAEKDDKVYLQGVIDCCFIENGAWVLLDYKTDYVPRGVSPEQAAEKHRAQLSLYAEALEKLTKTPVRETYVVLLSIGRAVLL